jgi:hypothetical protein
MELDISSDLRIWLARQRQLQIIRRAEFVRLMQLDKASLAETCPDLDYGVRGRIGGLLVSVGRALDPARVPCDDPCADGA